jgi:hypothetical protein
MKDDLNDEVPNGGPCYTFLRLDRKTYCMKFNLKVFICRRYNGREAYDVSVIYNGWK